MTKITSLELYHFRNSDGAWIVLQSSEGEICRFPDNDLGRRYALPIACKLGLENGITVELKYH